MRKRSSVNPLTVIAVLVFPLFTIFISPVVQGILSTPDFLDNPRTGFLIIKITWIVLGILIAGLCVGVSRDNSQVVRIIIAVWTAILVFLVAGMIFGFAQSFFLFRHTILSALGSIMYGATSTVHLEITTGVYIVLLFLSGSSRRR